MRPTLIHFLLILLLLGTGAGASAAERASAAEADPVPAPVVVRIRIDDQPITPVTARFVERGLREAETAGAEALILELDTPGGLLDSTRDIVGDILASPVPVVVYVSPSGARAASAGLFITLSGHVAAMAPSTRIGAAHPVQMGGPPGMGQPADSQQGKDGPEKATDDRSAREDKVVRDTAAWARSLAELRGRNAEWAALAVTESRTILADEAVETGVVELMAEDLSDLLEQLDGREVTVSQGEVQLQTAAAEVRTLEMWWGERMLGVLSNPNVAFLLMMFGFYGVLFELYSPGWGVAGTLGILCLVLGLFGLAVLPINYAALALVAVALALFVAEALVTSFGVLAVAGIACLVLGGTMLVESPGEFARISLAVLVPVAVATGLITVLLVTGIVRAHRGRAQTGSEQLVGQKAAAHQEFAQSGEQYRGLVAVHGELWRAVSPDPVAAEQTVEVKGREGLTLQVQPMSPQSEGGGEEL